MVKRLTITPAMGAKIAKAAGVETIDTSHFAVFEMVVMNTEPVHKAGSIFDKSVMTKATLYEMADVIARGESVPLQIMHEPGLPVGKLFDAQVIDIPGTGKPELRGQFYMDTRTHGDLVLGIDNGTTDEVSLGARPKSLNCSACGFDYMAEGNEGAFYSRTCADGHVLHVGGIHVKFNGLDRWYETSLVSKGAAKNPKILSPAKALLGDEEYRRLTASGISPDAYIFHGSCTTIRKDHTEMDIKVLEAAITDKVKAQADLAAASTKVTALETQVTELTTKITGLEAAQTAGVAELQTKLDGTKPGTDFIAEACKAAMTAKGETGEIPAKLEDQIAMIKATSNALHQIPLGGKAKPSASEDEKPKADLSAFKTR